MTQEFAHPLILTSPHIHGQRVRDAQYLLAGHDRFPGLATYKDGAIDGDYGPLTAQATKRCKFWLGYPSSACTPVFGQTLYEYLRPAKWRPLPADYRKRRDDRLAAAARTPGQEALDYAAQYIGYHEELDGHGLPTTNLTIFGAWYRVNGVPWCAIFESYCFAHTGYSRFHFASVEMIYEAARLGHGGLYLVRTPQPGDVALYSFPRERYAHTAFVDHVVEPGRSFVDLGGNTSSASFSNGGYVERHERDFSLVTAFARAA